MMEQVVLLVEDNADDEALTLRAFRKNNICHKIAVAHDGVEALDYLFATGAYDDRRASSLPCLVILDLKLPKVSGLEVLERLRADKRTKLLPIVVLTSSKEDQDLITSYSLGANSYIRKPIDFTAFTEVVRQLGAYWLMINEQPPQGDW